MNECYNNKQLILSVYDCGSKNIQTTKDYWKGEYILQTEKKQFSRAYSFNKAVEGTNCDNIFLCDADMTLPKDFIEQFSENVAQNTIWFPICYSLHENKPRKINGEENGWWRDCGYGMVGCKRNDYWILGGLNESFKEWGGEDNAFYDAVEKMKMRRVRKNSIGLFHNWHPHQWQEKYD